jgi:hypothetical protein
MLNIMSKQGVKKGRKGGRKKERKERKFAAFIIICGVSTPARAFFKLPR